MKNNQKWTPKNIKNRAFFEGPKKREKNQKSSKFLKKSKKVQKQGPKRGPKRPRPGGPKRGQKSLFLTIPRHMRGAKGVFGPFWGFLGKWPKLTQNQ